MSMTQIEGGAQITGAITNPFLRAQASHIAAGTVAIESERAIAEAQGKLIVAKRFPRDEASAYARVMESCRRPTLAAVANYKFPRAGQPVSGPSIRLAEELARCWGNIDYGLRELSRRDGESEMEAFAWDLETNTMSSQRFTARHIRDKRSGAERLHDERDIYELTANLGARRLRARILAILPPDLVDAAVTECRKTQAGDNTVPLADQVRSMTQAFSRLGVNADMLATKLGHALDDVTPDELADLRETYTSIKDGIAKVSEFFGGEKTAGSRLDAIEGKIAEAEIATAPVEKTVSKPTPAAPADDFPGVVTPREPPDDDSILPPSPLSDLREMMNQCATNKALDACMQGATWKASLTKLTEDETAMLRQDVSTARRQFHAAEKSS